MPYMLRNNKNEYLVEDWATNHESSFTKDERFAFVCESLLSANKINKSYFSKQFEPVFTTRQNNLIHRKRFVSLREFTV
jgi:hypothetical protein